MSITQQFANNTVIIDAEQASFVIEMENALIERRRFVIKYGNEILSPNEVFFNMQIPEDVSRLYEHIKNNPNALTVILSPPPL